MKKVVWAFAITAMISGCGNVPAGAEAPAWDVDGLSTISTGAEVPYSPSILQINGQWLVAYESRALGNKSVYLASSTDAIHWNCKKLFAGQEPYLFAKNGQPAIAYSNNWQLEVATFESTGWNSAPLAGVAEDATAPSVTALKDGGYAIAYTTLAGECYVAKTQDAQNCQANEMVTDTGYHPSIAQAQDGSLAVAYETAKGISKATQQQGKWVTNPAINNREALSPCLLAQDTGISLYFTKPVDGHRAVIKQVADQEEVILSNGVENLMPAVLLQGDEEYIAVGIKNTVGARGVFLAKKP